MTKKSILSGLSLFQYKYYQSLMVTSRTPANSRSYGANRFSSNTELDGWIAHAFPDTSTYYTHPYLRLTTDMDLSEVRVREALMRYVEETMGGGEEASVPEGWEVWVHDETLVKGRVPAQLHQDRGRKAERETKKDAKKDAMGKSVKNSGAGWREVREQITSVIRMNPVRCWVNHGARAMGYWPPPAFGAGGSAASLPAAAEAKAVETGTAADDCKSPIPL